MRARSRRLWLALTVAVTAALTAAAVLAVTPLTRADATAGPVPAAQVSAQQACWGVASAQAAVGQHAAPAVVLMLLARARDTAREAWWLDLRWSPLHTGLEVLLTALSGPDGRDAERGLQLVRQACPQV